MNIPQKIEDTYNVRVSRDDEPVTVTRIYDMSNLTEDDVMSYALDSIRILCQGKDRRDALKKDSDGTIKDNATYVVPRPGSRTIATAESRLVKAFGKEKAEKAIEKFGSAEEALEALKSFLED